MIENAGNTQQLDFPWRSIYPVLSFYFQFLATIMFWISPSQHCLLCFLSSASLMSLLLQSFQSPTSFQPKPHFQFWRKIIGWIINFVCLSPQMLTVLLSIFHLFCVGVWSLLDFIFAVACLSMLPCLLVIHKNLSLYWVAYTVFLFCQFSNIVAAVIMEHQCRNLGQAYIFTSDYFFHIFILLILPCYSCTSQCPFPVI